MLVVCIMRHDHFAFEAVSHFQCLPVFRVLFCNDFAGAEEISSGDAHSYQEDFTPL